MRKVSFVLIFSTLLATLFPVLALAATVSGAQSLVVSEPTIGNTYLAGGDIAVVTPVSGDLLAAAGNITVSEPVSGDAMLAGLSVDVRKPVAGDFRAIGGRITVESSLGGDLFAAGSTIDATGTPSYVFLVGNKVTLHNGAKGPVRIYGGTIVLAGDYASDVVLTASDSITISPGTHIHGALRYDGPQEADISNTAVIDGGVHYTGASYLPTTQQARTFAIAGAGIFLLIRLLSILIAAGLLTGLFPAFAETYADKALWRTSRFFLLALLGFAVMAATPILLFLLLISFAGIAVALILGSAYILLLLLSYIYAGILIGAFLARQIWKRSHMLWRDGVLGMLVLAILSALPFIGWPVLLIVWTASAGTIVSLCYNFIFPKREMEDDDLI